jgi:hypothetical protein
MKKNGTSKASSKSKKPATRDLSPLAERTSKVKAGRLSARKTRKS